MSKSAFRTEQDSLGSMQVPADALYGAQTQRAIENFPVSGIPLPLRFIHAILQIKQAAAEVNRDLELLKPGVARAIIQACDELMQGEYRSQFPIDVFQTGSGTSSNMNVNEVVANLASQSGEAVHPNDHVNMSQSSNDVIPSAIHLSAALALEETLLPALRELAETLDRRSEELQDVCKTGRTHLMDAMPITFGQELSAWASQVLALIHI